MAGFFLVHQTCEPTDNLDIMNTVDTASLLAQDAFQRPINDLRISVTDRCNFRCTYCMPKEVFGKNFAFMPHDELLNFDEITRIAQVFTKLGVQKIRLTGGEPLLRKQLEKLVEMLAQIRTPSGQPLELAMTTNGSILEQKARVLKEAGLHRVTVSLDTLHPERFQSISDVAVPVEKVFKGIATAQSVGLDVKLNMVVKRGINDQDIVDMAAAFRHTGQTLRFIEFMDVGNTNGWKMDQVVRSQEVLALIHERWPLEPIDRAKKGETAERWRYVDGGGEIGLISSVSQPFCRDCNRARLSTEGKLYTCLFASRGHDLKSLIRGKSTDEEIELLLRQIWSSRTDRYSELRSSGAALPMKEQRIEMHYIGG